MSFPASLRGSSAPWSRPAAEVLDELGASPAGLDPATAAARAAVSPNELPRPRGPRTRELVLDQLRDTFVLLLLASCAIAVAVGDVRDAAVIATVVVVNTTLGVLQAHRAEQALESLRSMTRTHATVVRGGTTHTVDAVEVACGDVLHLAAGDAVPADARLLQADLLSCDESALTGESLPVDKHVEPLPLDTPVADRRNSVFAGTTVVTGSGRATVVATGTATEIGRIAASLQRAVAPPTPLQKQLQRLGKQVAIGAGLVCLLVAGLGLLRGEGWEVMLLTGTSLAVAAVPESLPAVVAVSLALGAQRMAKRNAVVRTLPAIETLGAVTVIATDKTGTLTEGQLTVVDAWHPGSDATELWEAAVLCNDADTDQAGDPLERALVEHAGRLGVDVDSVRADRPRRATVPFDPTTRRMTTTHDDSGTVLVVCKGAPEAVLPLTPQGCRTAAAEVAARLAEGGLRVLAVARGRSTSDLVLVGLVAFADPVRPTASAAVATCARAGIRPVLVTGDHVGTAIAVARSVGIPVDGARTGLPEGDDVPPVLARVTPEEKLEVVERLQARGEVVAMTGDGVNDAPALRRADVGVAMGRNGTDVARAAADIVLLDDDFATVVAAVAEGRRVSDSIKRFLLYAMSGGAAELFVMLGGPALGFALPLLPAQVLWVNLLTHGPPGVALGAGAASQDVLSRPPRKPGAPLVDAVAWRRLVGLGAVIATISLGTALAVDAAHGSRQAAVFLTLAAQQLGVALVLGGRGRSLLAAVAGSALLLLAALAWPPLRGALGLPTLSLMTAAAVLPASLIAPALARRWS